MKKRLLSFGVCLVLLISPSFTALAEPADDVTAAEDALAVTEGDFAEVIPEAGLTGSTDAVTYTIDLSDQTITATYGTETVSTDISINAGALLWSGDTITWKHPKNWSILSNECSTIVPNATFTCHHAALPREPQVYTTSVGLEFVPLSGGQAVSECGTVGTGEYNLVSGSGTTVYDETKSEDEYFESLAYEPYTVADSFSAGAYPVRIKWVGRPIFVQAWTDCGHGNQFDVFKCYVGSKLSVEPFLPSNVTVTFNDASSLFGDDDYPKNFSFQNKAKEYHYTVPVKAGKTFGGFRFLDGDGRQIGSDIIEDDGNGTILFKPLTDKNFDKMKALAESGIRAEEIWVGETMTLNYHLNGGIYNNDFHSFTRLVNDPASYVLPTPERDGYTFDGWEVDGTKVTDISAITPNAEQVYDLTANWVLVSDPGYAIEPDSETLTVSKNNGYPDLSTNLWFKKIKNIVAHHQLV